MLACPKLGALGEHAARLWSLLPDARLGWVADLWGPGRDKLGDKPTPGQAALVAAVKRLSSTPERFAGGHGTVAEYAPLAALAELRKAHQLSPGDERIALTLAQIEGRSGRREAALSLARSVLQQDPELPQAHFLLGWLLAPDGQGTGLVLGLLAAGLTNREIAATIPTSNFMVWVITTAISAI